MILAEIQLLGPISVEQFEFKKTKVEVVGSFWFTEPDPQASKYFVATVIRFVSSSEKWLVEFVNADGTVEQCLIPFDETKWRWPIGANQD